MTTTPFRRVLSRPIYGADITGLQDAVNRLEGVLSSQRGVAVAGHAMSPVEDQADIGLHRRIYEASLGFRNWLETPAPVIRRGGVVVSPGEYTLYAAQGMIEFTAQQTGGSAITADFTHLAGVAAVSEPTPQRLILRDINGRAQVATPTVAADIARLDTVDAARVLFWMEV